MAEPKSAGLWANSVSRGTGHYTIYKSLSYIGSLHKCKIGEEWRHRWTNQHTTLCSNFHVANHIPLSTKPIVRLMKLDHHTFSWTLQCHTGHHHIRDYYH